MSKKEKKSLEQVLLDAGALTREQVDVVLEKCRETGRPLGETLVSGGFIPKEKLAPYLAEHIGVPFLDLNTVIIHPDIVKIIPEATAKKFKLVPVFKVKNAVTMAMADPLDFNALDALKRVCGKHEIKTVMALPEDIDAIIQRYYGISESIDEVLKGFDLAGVSKEMKDKGDPTEFLNKLVKEAPVIKVVDLIIEDAVKRKASDIHLEPEDDKLSVRLRVDGLLHETAVLPKLLQEAIISRVKIMAELDISQKRIPQDGKIRTNTTGRDIDLRISTYPTPYGEDVVMRVLDTSSALVGLEKLGFSADCLEKFGDLIKSPNGIILVTGPTGSGKTTTLYSALNKINTPDKKIITIEDPIEYEMRGIRQSQTNAKAGFVFATGLRAILRHDPDIVMVGEIRDFETAEIAVQASLTGHLVFSTLHTNDAPSAATRLIDMGLEPFLIVSSVLGVMAQRLVRVICPKCKTAYNPAKEVLDQLGLPADTVFYRGKGCNNCMNTGYSGRVMIAEIMVFTDPIKELILKKVSSSVLRDAALKDGMATIRQDGINKVLDGITTIEEIFRVS